jgi:Flp pilus assembly protein protease CpaA
MACPLRYGRRSMNGVTPHFILHSVATAILFAGVVNDLRSRKVYNWLSLTCAIVALVTVTLLFRVQGLQMAGLGILAAVLLTIPLVLSGILGAGDAKLFWAFAMTCSWATVFLVLMYSFVWGALLGLTRSIVGGEFKAVLKNTAQIVMRQPVPTTTLHKIPFTVAIFFGWLTHMSLANWTGGF